MKTVLENLSIALGYKGEINEAVKKADKDMKQFGMDSTEIETYALYCTKVGHVVSPVSFGKDI
tara:strand:+ start:626 stop:814 length:189 start_codon:yes stop_codon:yes gene_type:complete